MSARVGGQKLSELPCPLDGVSLGCSSPPPNFPSGLERQSPMGITCSLCSIPCGPLSPPHPTSPPSPAASWDHFPNTLHAVVSPVSFWGSLAHTSPRMFSSSPHPLRASCPPGSHSSGERRWFSPCGDITNNQITRDQRHRHQILHSRSEIRIAGSVALPLSSRPRPPGPLIDEVRYKC